MYRPKMYLVLINIFILTVVVLAACYEQQWAKHILTVYTDCLFAASLLFLYIFLASKDKKGFADKDLAERRKLYNIIIDIIIILIFSSFGWYWFAFCYILAILVLLLIKNEAREQLAAANLAED